MINVCGTECSVVYHTTGPMRATEVARLLDLLKVVTEAAMGGLYSLFISVSDGEMDLSVECAAELSFLASPDVTVQQEDGLVACAHKDRRRERCLELNTWALMPSRKALTGFPQACAFLTGRAASSCATGRCIS